MDQIAALALKALIAYKQQLDTAAATTEVAKTLSRKVELFEVTVSMIPKRGKEEMQGFMKKKGKNGVDIEEVAKSRGGGAVEWVPSDSKDNAGPKDAAASGEEKPSGPIRSMVKFVFGFACEQGKKMLLDEASQYLNLTPFQIVSDIISMGSGDDPSEWKKLRAGEILELMRKNGASDMDVSFAGMHFIVYSAMQVINGAVQDVMKVEPVTPLWVLMPWKVHRQGQLGETLKGHFEAIDKFNIQLQSAISVASYSVSVEQLENTLNASKILVCEAIRKFWKRKLGVNNTKVTVQELCEAFFEEVADILKLHKKKFRPEIYPSTRVTSEVLLHRFLGFLWTADFDNWATVYEVNKCTERYAEEDDAVRSTCQRIINLELKFFSAIDFRPLLLDADGDASQQMLRVATEEDSLGKTYGVDLNPSDRVIIVKPFERIRIFCKVPMCQEELCPYDFITLMKFSNKNITKLQDIVVQAGDRCALDEVDGKRAYLTVDSNREFYGYDFFSWNTPFVIKTSRRKDTPKIRFGTDVKITNFERSPIATEESDDIVTFKDVQIRRNVTMLYTPVISEPGFYTVRYGLDNLQLSEDETPRTANKRKLLFSSKTYYHNKSIEQATETTVGYNSNIGKENYEKCLLLQIKMYQIFQHEAYFYRYTRDITRFADLIRDNKAKLKLASNPNQEIKSDDIGVNIDEVSVLATEKEAKKDDGIMEVGKNDAVKYVITALKNKYLKKETIEKVDAWMKAFKLPEEYKKKIDLDPELPNKLLAMALHRIILAFEIGDLIKNVEKYMEEMLSKWSSSIEASLLLNQLTSSKKDLGSEEKELLLSIDSAILQLRQLQDLQKSVIPAEIIDILSPPPPQATPVKDVNAKETYLIHPGRDRDRSSDAKNALNEELFARYVYIKTGILSVDAKETISQVFVRRCQMLQERYIKLIETAIDSASKANTPQPASAPGANRRGSNTNVSKLSDYFVTFAKTIGPIENRDQIKVVVKDLIKSVQAVYDRVLDDYTPNSKTSSEASKTGDQLSKVLTELQYILEQAGYPGKKAPSEDDINQIVKSRTIPPYGIIIQVSNENALAWGEVYDDPNQDDVSDSQMKAEDTASRKNWRLILDYYYPYSNKTSLNYRKDRYDEYNQLKLAIFVNRATEVEQKPTGKGDKTKQPKGPEIPTFLGVFVKKDDKFIMKKIVDIKALKVVDNIPFHEYIMSQNSIQSAEFVVRFLAKDIGENLEKEPMSDKEIDAEGLNSLTLPDGPELKLQLSDEGEDDSDVYNTDEYEPQANLPDDDDDDEDGDDEDDEDDDEDDDDEYKALKMAETTEALWDYLPDEITETIGGEQMTMKKMKSVYFGEYGCDVCDHAGHGVAYHTTDNTDAHPQCCSVFPNALAAYKLKQLEGFALPDTAVVPNQSADWSEWVDDEPPKMTVVKVAKDKTYEYTCTDCDGVGLGTHYQRDNDDQSKYHPQCILEESIFDGDEYLYEEKFEPDDDDEEDEDEDEEGSVAADAEE